jgi:hypothetical protein
MAGGLSSRGKGIKRVSDLFTAYQTRFRAPEKSVLSVFIDVVSEVVGITIRLSECSYTPVSQLLTLTTRGPQKTEILLRKKEILTHMKGRLGEKSAPRDIV